VKKRTAQLEQKKQQMQALNKQFVGRELRMIELQEEIARLQSEVSVDSDNE
jgi:predicted  nucleic acid-binding Zn-ribbon protein